MKINDKIEGILEINPGGSGYLITDKGEKIYVYKRNTGKGLDGDRVELEVIEGKSIDTIEGKVVNLIKRKRKNYIGTLSKRNKTSFLILDSKRIPVDFYVDPKQSKKYKEGEKLLVEIKKWNLGKNPECKIVKSLGFMGENSAEMDSIIHEYNLNTKFPKEVEKESEDISWEITEDEVKKRKDFRDITTFTIDPETAKDFDDAISIRKIKNLYEIGIHIADVSHYVKLNTELDNEAYSRATSVYLVDRVIPMLPERLSNGVCSLRPNEDKLTYSVVLKMNKKGEIKDHWIGRTIIHSDRRFTYEEAQEIIEGKEDKFKNEILILNEISQNLRKERNSILFNSSEVKFNLDHEFKPVGIRTEESNESHQLIEELMLLANKIVGKFLSDNNLGIYRNHDQPNEEKLKEFQEIVKHCGFELNLNYIRIGLNDLNIQSKDTPFENMIQTLGVRCMSKAEYGINNIGHYGLGFKYYSHFTSPIRRYPDIIAHRLITKFLDKESPENPVKYQDKCNHCNRMELNAKSAERDSIKFKQVEFLMDKVGHVFSGTITGITDFGVYVEINENKCTGLIKSYDIFGNVDRNNFKIEMRDGRTFRLGDNITVKVSGISLLKKEIDLLIF